MMPLAVISVVTEAVFTRYPLFAFLFRVTVKVMERYGVL